MEPVTKKLLTQGDRIKQWVQYNPNTFLAWEIVEEFPDITRRVIEKTLQVEVLKGKLLSSKCRCKCANVYERTDIKPVSEHSWT